jgi:hypothetical protein
MKSTNFKLFSTIAALGLASAIAVHAFSLLGPFEDWQEQRIGIGPELGDIGGPKNLQGFYRINVPVITYAYDPSFILFFGTNGVAALESMIQFMNNLPPMSRITNDGVNFYVNGLPVPMDTKFPNFEAGTLGLFDLKSTAWNVLLEELGLAEPERFAWTLLSRRTPAPGVTNFGVIPLNFDPITLAPTPFVNGVRYSYQILDGQVVSDAVEFILDPLESGFNSVAGENAFQGQFFTGLSHDDLGGLRYLYRTNTVAVETLLPTVTARTAGSITPTNLIGAPWTPLFLVTNVFGTNVTGNTNLTNLIVNAAPRPGINKLFFQRVEFDSIVGNFVPRTNLFADVFYTNSRARFQLVQRAITAPDYIFAAGHTPINPAGFPAQLTRTVTDGWINNDAINGNTTVFGPGVITTPILITFTDQWPAILHSVPFLDEFSSLVTFAQWGSFDGTTNAPILYPQFGSWTLQARRNAVVGGQQ